MAIREIRVLGDDVLTKHCKEITKMSIRTKILIEDMLCNIQHIFRLLRC